MKFLFIGFFVLLCTTGSFGQISLKGRIAADDRKPIPSANVLLMNAGDSTLIKGCIVNDSGEYKMDRIAPGKYYLSYTAIGFRTCSSPSFELTPSQDTKDFGMTIMSGENKQLQEIVIRAQKPVFQLEMNRTVINVQNSVFTKGSSILEVLARSPGVVVDHHNNSIILNGKNGVGIMINGKLVRLPPTEIYNMLDGMSANNIEKIELLPVPPAKYDAEGTAGMINIILKKNEEHGTNGSYSLTGGYGMHAKSMANLNINHRNSLFNIYGAYSYSYDKTYWEVAAKGGFQFPKDIGKGERTYDFINERRPAKSIHNVNIGIDYNLDKKTTIGLSSMFSGVFQTSEGYTRSKYTIYGDSILQLRSDMHEKDNLRSTINDLNIERTLGKGGKISFDVDYIHYVDKNPSSYLNSFLDKDGNNIDSHSDGFFPEQQAIKETGIDILVYKADYEQKFGASTKLEAGFKVSDSKIVNTVGVNDLKNGSWRTDSSVSSRMTMKEPVSALYSSLDFEVDKTNITLGLRYEHTTTDVDFNVKTQNGVHRNYGNLFPSVFLWRKLSEKSNARLTYNRRIRRPSYNDIAPGITFNDIYSIIIGNPLLKPVISDNLQAQYQYKQTLFSLMFSRENNAIVDGQQTEGLTDSIFYQMSHNLKYQESLTLQTSFPIQLASWWKMTNTLTGAWNQFQTRLMPTMNFVTTNFRNSYFTYNFYSSQNFTLPKKFYIELSAEYYSIDWWGSYRRAAFGVLNLGVKKELKNKGTLQLSVTDLLESTHYRTFLDVPHSAFNIHSNIDISPEPRKSRIVKLTFYKSFGSNKVKSQRQWDLGSQDEQERINK